MRLKVVKMNEKYVITVFQFLLVRLKAGEKTKIENFTISFQFLLVRLKEMLETSNALKEAEFQFLLVRLKDVLL